MAEIIINGTRLNGAQTFALRVAIASFNMDVSDPDFLGEDELYQKMAQAYRDRLIEIIRIWGAE